MKIKHKNYNSTTLNRFDLLGNDETGLSKAFAYLLSVEPIILYKFVRELGVKTNNTESNFKKLSIDIERKRQEGRTDIEIYHPEKFHIIIECKVKTNRIKSQRNQYKQSFENASQKILCFITQERDNTHELSQGVDVYYKGWFDIIDIIDQKDFDSSEIIKEFVSYITKGFKMRNQKEVLIQDLSKPDEVALFKENYIYRRDVTFGSPLYFAPYFTRAAQETEGISYLSKVLGVLSIKPQDIKIFKDELYTYAGDDKYLVEKWLLGIEHIESDQPVTYYFLASPVVLNKPLLKDRGREVGRGKGWVAAMIPKNRCVTFEEFAKRIILAHSS